ncbi:MAG: EamA family transporter [Aggregatilineales bacterium]
MFLGEQPKLLGVAGLSLIVIGLMTIGADAFWQRRHSARVQIGGIGVALGVACCISVYSAIDGAATRLVPPVSYLVVVLGLTAVLNAPFVLGNHGRRAILGELRARWQTILVGGGCMMAAYLIILYVFSMARVSYVGAAREISIVFAAFVGWRWLGERFGALRLVGALLLFCGIFVIALAG